MKNLKDISDSDLEQELARRQKAKKTAEAPQLLKPIDFSPLVAMVVENTKAIADCDEDAVARYDDFKQGVFETAIGCIYGSSYWEWLRKQRQ